MKGFMLIELMIIIAIVGILAAIIVPAASKWCDDKPKEVAPVEKVYTP